MDHCGSESSGSCVVAGDLQGEIDDLQYRLNEASSRIMQLLSPADQITDTEIGKKVESLQDAIQWWINGVEQDLRKQSQDFRSFFQRVLHGKDRARCLQTLGICNYSSRGADSEWLTWLGSLSTSIYVAMGRQIWGYLDEEIFSNMYPVAVSSDSAETFDDILSVMKSDSQTEGAYDNIVVGRPLLTK